MVRALVYIVPIALAIYALIELSRSDAAERAALHPLGWVAIIVLLPVFGPVAWILISRSRRQGPRTGPSGPGGRPGPARPGQRKPRGPVAPDDDPDFLWRLERDRRRAVRDEAGGAGPAPETTPPPPPPAPEPQDDAPQATPEDGSAPGR